MDFILFVFFELFVVFPRLLYFLLLIFFVNFLVKTHVMLYNGSNYDFHCMIKNLANIFNRSDFDFLREKAKKHISFPLSLWIKKSLTEKACREKTIKFKLRFLNMFQFLSISLETLTDDLSESIHKKNIIMVNASLVMQKWNKNH